MERFLLSWETYVEVEEEPVMRISFILEEILEPMCLRDESWEISVILMGWFLRRVIAFR